MNVTFDEKYSAAYRKLYEFHKRHHKAKTDKDYDAVSDGSAAFAGRFECDVYSAIVDEIERENENAEA